jgi:hypothetical protein
MKELGASGLSNFGGAVSMLALATLSVVLRLILRLSARLPITFSDWLIILSLALFAVYCGMMIHCELSWRRSESYYVDLILI